MKPHSKFRFLLIFFLLISVVSLSFNGIAFAHDKEQQSTFASPILVVNTSFLNIRTGPSASYSILVTAIGGTELPVLGVAKDLVWYQVATNAGVGWVNVTFTLPRGDFTHVPLATVTTVTQTTASLGQGGGFAAPTTGSAVAPVSSGIGVMGASINGGDMYAAPDPNAAVVRPAAGIDYSRIFPVLDVAYVDGRPFYKVLVPEWGIVWNDRFRIRPMACNGLSVLVIRDEAVGTLPIGTSPSFTLVKGDEAYVVGNGFDGLIEIQTMDGSRGLVPVEQTTGRPASEVDFCNGVAPSSQTVAGSTITNTTASLGQGGGGGGFITPAVTAAARVIVNTGNLNIRSGPSAGYSIVVTVPGGTELAVLGVYKDGVWYLVQGPFGQGWLNIEYVLARGDFSRVPLIKEPVVVATNPIAGLGQGGGFAAPTTATGGVAVTSGIGIMGASINGGDMYAAPDPNAAVVRPAAGIDYSRIFPVLDVAYVDGRPFYKVLVPEWGIVWNDRFRIRPMACNGLSVLVIRDERVGTLPIGTSPSFTLAKGDEAYVVGNGFDGLIEIQTMDGSRGLVPVEQTTGRPASEVDFCNGVAPSSQTVAGVATNTTASLGQGGVGGGFIRPAITAAARVIVNTGNLNIRTGPSASFSTVATVSGGTELAVLGVADDGVWYLVQGTFGQGWLNNEYVIFRGDYSSVPVLNINP